ncbi:MAG: oligoendopeptidase F [Rhodospirillaceae bacterium]|nr:oligoendopeptidase F [Rhodospirillaceae bacterium]
MSKVVELGALPEWDLSDLYPGMNSQELSRDLEEIGTAVTTFSNHYKGKISALTGDALAKAIITYEKIDETLSRIGSYASLVHAGNVSDPEIGRFYQTTNEQVNEISTTLLFFCLEVNRIEDDALEEMLQSAALQRYQPWLRDLRAFRPHQLDDKLEELLHEKSITGRSSWIRLFDQTIAEMRFPYRGRNLTETEILDLLSDPQTKVRKEAAECFGRVLGDNIKTFSLITNTLAKDKEIENRWRRFERPISSRNLANFVEDEVVDALLDSVSKSYPSLSHRYYKLKARWFGADTLNYWDRNAPLPDEDNRTIEWEEARETVLGAYGKFSPALADVGQRFFDNAWIDAPVRPGKASGAFAHPTVPSAHPYLLVNYQGKVRDVMTLAHELGHGVHQVLSAGQGHLMADTPLTLAETASVFGEMLTFQTLLKQTTNPTERRVMLASKVEDMLNTVVRQTAFCDFERRIHDERQSGEITPDRIGEIWLNCQVESLGPALKFSDVYQFYWAYIPHFIHTPFYVYAYAFGDCLVNSLYSIYQDAETGFADKYLDMLRAGGTLRHQDLLAPFGLNAAEPTFWSSGLSVIESFVDELETLTN